MVAHMTLIYIQYQWRGDHTIHLHGPQNSQWFHVVVAITYWHVCFARFCMNFIVLTRLLIHLPPRGVINLFKRAFSLFICFTSTFYLLGNFYTNAIFLGHLSFLLLYTSQTCLHCVLPGPFHHFASGYYPWSWLPEQQRLISPLSSHTLHRRILSSYVLKVITCAVINDHWRLLEKLQNNSEPSRICNFHRWFAIITQNESCLSCRAKLFFHFPFTAV